MKNELIKTYNEKKEDNLMSLVKSSDGTLVFFKKQFDTDTGEEKDMETVDTTTKEALIEEKAELQAQIDIIDAFLLEEKLIIDEVK